MVKIRCQVKVNASTQKRNIDNENKIKTSTLESETIHQNKVMNKVIYMNDDNTNIILNLVDDNKGFKMVSHRCGKPVQGKQPTNNNTPFKAAVKDIYIYVGNLLICPLIQNVKVLSNI